MSLMYLPFAIVALFSFSKKIKDVVLAFRRQDAAQVKVHSLFLFLMVVVVAVVYKFL
jgi:hypothetical protein